jgi:hypothetical protein
VIGVDLLALAAKAALAALLLVAAGAKLADLDGFGSTVRLFVPRRGAMPAPRTIAVGITLAELALGAASLSCPAASWLNPVVLAVGCAFLLVSVVGFAAHRGRSCRCFGALTRRTFDAAGIARSAVIAAAAAVAITPVPASSVRLAAAERVLLLAASGLLAIASFTAARALAAGRQGQPGWAAS